MNRPLRGQEVSCQPILPFFEALRARGLPDHLLSEGTGYSAAHLTDPRNRVSWAGFSAFMANVERGFDDAEILEIGATLPTAAGLRTLILVTRLLYSVADAYLFVFAPGGPASQMVTAVEADVHQVGPNEITLRTLMRPGYAPSRANFVAMQGTLQSLSSALGFGPAQVAMTLLADGAHFRVRLPPGGGKLAWLRRALSWPFATRSAAAELLTARDEVVARSVELHSTLEQLPIGCIRSDLEGTVISTNQACEDIFGLTQAEIVGGRWWDVLTTPAARADAAAGFRRVVEGGSVSPAEFAGRTRDDEAVRCEWRHRLIVQEHSSTSVLSMVQDLSARYRLQDQLVQASKMEAVGHLAAGVAHDFNNLVTVIIGYTEILAERLPPGHPGGSDLAQIRGAADRATRLTRQLLAFSRPEDFSPEVLDLRHVVEETLGLLDRLLGSDIAVSLTGEATGYVKADPDQIGQLVVTLAVNARDAMPDGGRLQIDLSDAERDGPTVQLSMTDTGIGMDAHTCRLIFDPFFTTKQPGKGTGLGLSTAYAIVQRSGGFLTVESELGKGSTFRVFLPRFQGALTLPPPRPEPVLEGKGETILLIEDDEAV